jgi:glycosyltransferase involved in cell wall biosynthesis
MEPLRILDLRDSPWVDGPGRTVLETAERVNSDRFTIIVGGFYSGDASDNVYLGAAKGRSLEICPIPDSHAYDIRFVKAVAESVRRLDIHVVHTHDFRSSAAGYFATRKAGIPLVTTCHGWITNSAKGHIYKQLDIQLLRRFDMVITVSDKMSKYLKSRGFRDDILRTIPNTLVTEDYVVDKSDSRFRDELSIPKSTKLIANIGRLSPEKGQDLLIEAASVVLADRQDILLVFVGIGSEKEHLEEKAASLGMTERVRFVGYRTDMSRIYNSVDLVVQSSLTEGMPNVILEALLMETPVIATDVGGTSEIVEHGVSGYLIDAGATSQISSAINDFLQREQNHREMARRGSQKVRSEFDSSRRVELLESVYSSVAKSIRGVSI